MPLERFAQRVVTWQKHSGRHDLPWQGSADPYRIWVAEIMLQQTQVAAVVGYYGRFMAQFPRLEDLAGATLDAVMPYWAGLGYYSRARNLHACAQAVQTQYGGVFPADPGLLEALPGIGRSTAAAIAAFAYGVRAPILDGNVRRVLCRAFGIEGDPASRPVLDRLWSLAAQLLPEAAGDMPTYTQGLMDLGATCCTRSRPACAGCPLEQTCIARRESRTAQLPTPRKVRPRAGRSLGLVVMRWHDRVWLERRPDRGIWGGLWSLPEIAPTDDPLAVARQRGWRAEFGAGLPAFAHGFTHLLLHAQPYLLEIDAATEPLRNAPSAGRSALVARDLDAPDGPGAGAGVGLDRLAQWALPKPIRTLLEALPQTP